VRLCRLAIIANPIAEDQPLLLVARLTQVVSNEDFRLVPGPFLNAVAIWRRARAQRLLRICVFVCVLVIYDQNDSVPHLLLSKKFFFLLTLLLLLHEIHTYRCPQGGLLLTTAVLHQRLLVRVLGCRRRRVRRREHFSSVFFFPSLLLDQNCLPVGGHEEKRKVPLEKKNCSLYQKEKRRSRTSFARASREKRKCARRTLEDLVDDDDDDAKKKSSKKSVVGWFIINPPRRAIFFFCRVGHADSTIGFIYLFI